MEQELTPLTETTGEQPRAADKEIRIRRWPALLIAATAFLFFWQYFLLDQTLFAGDTAFVMLPFRHFTMGRLARGELPLWNPYLFGGTPALAEAQYQVFYLPNLLLYLPGVTRGMGWMLPLHLSLMAAGTYLFARRSLQLGQAAAAFAALAFAFGGCAQSRLAVSVFTEAAAWLPWILLAYDGARRRGGAALALPGVFLALQLVTGAPQYTYYTLALLFAFHLYRLREEPAHARRAWAALGGCIALGGLLSAGQLLPQLELARLSDRGMHPSYHYSTEFSLAPRHFFPTVVLPAFWGTFSGPPRDAFFPGEEQGYLGLASVGLIGAALAALRGPAAPRRKVLFWLAVGTLAVLVALGRNNPLYPLLYRLVPGIAMFRAPARWLLVASFAGAMLAGIGMEKVLRTGTPARAAARSGLLFLAALFVVAAGAALAVQAPVDLGVPMVLFLLTAGALGFLGFAPDGLAGTARRWAPLALLGVLILDLFVLSLDMEMQHTLPVQAVDPPPPTAVHLRAAAPQDRFWSGHDQVPMESWQMPQAREVSPQEFRARSAAGGRNLVPSCLAAQFGTSGLTGAWGALMPLYRHPRPIYDPATPWEQQRKWLRLLNVGRHLALRSLSDPQLRLESSDPLPIYQDPGALPRAFWVPRVRAVRGAEALQAVSAPDFDPRREAALEPAPGGEVAASAPAGGAFTPARLAEYRPERVSLEVTAPARGPLVLMDTLYPGWKATVDGQPAALRPANWVGRGLELQAGPHRVEMRFMPASVRAGLFFSLFALFLTAAWVTGAWRRSVCS